MLVLARNCKVDSMPIIYALVARGTTVLSEHTTTVGNVSTVAQKVLEHIPHGENKMSYIYDRYVREVQCMRRCRSRMVAKETGSELRP